jgi:hypothetical protein
VHFNDLESGGTSAGLLAVVNQTVDWIRLPPKVSGPNPRYNKISNYSQDRPDRHRGGGSSRFVDASGRLPPAPRARRKHQGFSESGFGESGAPTLSSYLLDAGKVDVEQLKPKQFLKHPAWVRVTNGTRTDFRLDRR